MNKGPCGVRQSLEHKDFALVLFGVLVPDMGLSCYEKVYLGKHINWSQPRCMQVASGEASHAGSAAKPCFSAWPGWCL